MNGTQLRNGGILHVRHHAATAEAVRKAVADSVPSSFRGLNLKAFDKGYEYGLTAQAGAPPKLEEVEYARE